MTTTAAIATTTALTSTLAEYADAYAAERIAGMDAVETAEAWMTVKASESTAKATHETLEATRKALGDHASTVLAKGELVTIHGNQRVEYHEQATGNLNVHAIMDAFLLMGLTPDQQAVYDRAVTAHAANRGTARSFKKPSKKTLAAKGLA